MDCMLQGKLGKGEQVFPWLLWDKFATFRVGLVGGAPALCSSELRGGFDCCANLRSVAHHLPGGRVRAGASPITSFQCGTHRVLQLWL